MTPRTEKRLKFLAARLDEEPRGPTIGKIDLHTSKASSIDQRWSSVLGNLRSARFGGVDIFPEASLEKVQANIDPDLQEQWLVVGQIVDRPLLFCRTRDEISVLEYDNSIRQITDADNFLDDLLHADSYAKIDEALTVDRWYEFLKLNP